MKFLVENEARIQKCLLKLKILSKPEFNIFNLKKMKIKQISHEIKKTNYINIYNI